MVRGAVTAALALVVAAAGTAAGGVAKPSLAVVERQPLVVRGAHFGARELVRVTAVSDGSESVRVRATRRGTFVVTLPGLTVDRCSGLGIRAVGGRGHVAAVKLPLPACLPARSP